ncbi:MAG TPA: hypothetical protein VM433_12650 [Mycobacteriales bacterium]|nr:hypothetical protein [Egibacteraceae bacterium]HVM28502.1 hypothetical protein [Mycobacteriales bacterium]
MTNCTISGTFAVTLSGKYDVSGNDFSKAVGVRFLDGVELAENKFATDGSQIVVRRDHRGWPSVLARADAGNVLADDLRRKLSGPQSWAVLYESQTDRQDWLFYAGIFGPAASRARTMTPGPEESMGRGVVYFLAATNDAEAWEHALHRGSPQTFDAHLTISGLEALGAAVGLDREATATRLQETDEKMLVGLSPDLVQALRDASRPEPLLRAWNAQTALLPEGEWADDPGAVLQVLLEVASSASVDQRLYAVITA